MTRGQLDKARAHTGIPQALSQPTSCLLTGVVCVLIEHQEHLAVWGITKLRKLHLC